MNIKCTFVLVNVFLTEYSNNTQETGSKLQISGQVSVTVNYILPNNKTESFEDRYLSKLC